MVYIGIDPGLIGAVAVLDQAGALIAVHDTPALTLRVARGTRQDYDLPGMAVWLRPYSGPGVHVIIEEAQAMPGQGVRSMWTTGYGFGAWLGTLATFGLPYTRVRPGVWKKALGLGKGDKEAARLRAQQLTTILHHVPFRRFLRTAGFAPTAPAKNMSGLWSGSARSKSGNRAPSIPPAGCPRRSH